MALSPAPKPAAVVARESIARESVVTAGDFTITVRANAFANLAYQLDCLGQSLHCAAASMHGFWSSSWTKDDDVALAHWRAIRKKYSGDVELSEDPLPSLVPLPHTSVELDKALRIAALLAATPDEYRSNLRPILPPQDVDALVAAAQHFRPRFETWWNASGAATGARFRVGLVQLFEKPELAAIITRAAAFYATTLARGTAIDFDLIVLPGKADSASGEQMLAHGVIELLDGQKAEDRMDVVCHELFHFFFNARSSEQQAALAARFTASSDPLAGLAYFLLDESVATALGNGVVNHAVNPPDYAKRRAKEQGFYMNHAIDATAKGLLARTSDDPTSGRLDSPETTKALIAATRDALGDDPRPIEYLHTLLGISNDSWWPEVMKVTALAASTNNEYRHALGAQEGVTMARQFPALSVVFVVPRADLALLDAYGDAIPKEARASLSAARAKTRAPFAFVFKRGALARGFVIVADDVGGAKSVADALFAQDKAVLGVFTPPH